MEILVVKDEYEAGRAAAEAVIEALADSSSPVLGVATGSSPLSTYRHLAEAAAAGRFDPAPVRAFALDEYRGISPEHPESYHAVIRREVCERVGLLPEHVRVPPGSAEDPVSACAEYEAAMAAAGGVDVQILGIGSNGHIGFNEPGSSPESRTRVQRLTPQTRQDNARFFGGRVEDVPEECVTQGIGTILEARRIVLLAQGESKAGGLAAMVNGPVTPECPASILQRHPSVLVVADEAAASQLARRI
ncbi:glucosamine-6-phosphate deaminase [Arthrobacter sp. UM1]|uniref:glucosamine-6-phosphate deaminase n=1 Tax=Arthrobacter sp. UM1 TaxID=2766776 RepID=UPI001CF6807A|nr:glucosamine-6-phosphate deaminase [Arthrobacter sp. UM1]MCB4208254.1 glucosamine-6-phosphate deaminase [Arthrobacter sp. UM1]